MYNVSTQAGKECLEENVTLGIGRERMLMEQKHSPKSVFSRKLFLKVLQDSQENTYAGMLLFNKVAGLQGWKFIKKRL